MKNMVDERFECAAVICRLAGRPEYSSPEFGAFNTDYHKEVTDTFAPFASHKAVDYARELTNIICYDKVLKFAVHIKKAAGKFVFIDDINSLFGAWNRDNSERFLDLFSQFYVDTDYERFFNSHLTLFEASTKKFVDEMYSHVDLKWFDKYVDSANLRCIYSLSSGNYAATVNGKIIYCLVHGGTPPITHEYCHSFADAIADKWYKENPKFRKWCDDSVNLEKLPFYNSGQFMAREYVTRAYDVLYIVEHGGNLRDWLAKERDFLYKDSFKYIGDVYNMILELEK
ncbi:MAG: DUF4932 domain-containing protein [Defluviitaleaceae bacterium]|nr:DUF4932 domain-containing protein [Defluviitaleaceae bacterium]